MLKTIGLILLVVVLSIIFIKPIRNCFDNLLSRDENLVKEERVIGMVSGFNPRVKEIQQILKDIGFEPGEVDGLMGRATRTAIKDFQQEKGLIPTGKVGSATLLALDREKEAIKPVAVIMPAFESLEEGVFVKNDLESENTVKEEKQEETKINAKQIQIALKKSGFYKGEIDGKIGPQTKKAIKEFQKYKSLKPDGIVGPKTQEELRRYLDN